MSSYLTYFHTFEKILKNLINSNDKIIAFGAIRSYDEDLKKMKNINSLIMNELNYRDSECFIDNRLINDEDKITPSDYGKTSIDFNYQQNNVKQKRHKYWPDPVSSQDIVANIEHFPTSSNNKVKYKLQFKHVEGSFDAGMPWMIINLSVMQNHYSDFFLKHQITDLFKIQLSDILNSHINEAVKSINNIFLSLIKINYLNKEEEPFVLINKGCSLISYPSLAEFIFRARNHIDISLTTNDNSSSPLISLEDVSHYKEIPKKYIREFLSLNQRNFEEAYDAAISIFYSDDELVNEYERFLFFLILLLNGATAKEGVEYDYINITRRFEVYKKGVARDLFVKIYLTGNELYDIEINKTYKDEYKKAQEIYDNYLACLAFEKFGNETIAYEKDESNLYYGTKIGQDLYWVDEREGYKPMHPNNYKNFTHLVNSEYQYFDKLSDISNLYLLYDFYEKYLSLPENRKNKRNAEHSLFLFMRRMRRDYNADNIYAWYIRALDNLGMEW